jgi:hypothetical protein
MEAGLLCYTPNVTARGWPLDPTTRSQNAPECSRRRSRQQVSPDRLGRPHDGRTLSGCPRGRGRLAHKGNENPAPTPRNSTQSAKQCSPKPSRSYATCRMIH